MIDPLGRIQQIVKNDLAFSRFRFVACSGATIAQVNTQVSQVPSFLKQANLTTVTAGGNDLPFFGLIAACLGAVASAQSVTIKYLPGVSSQTGCNSAVGNAARLLGATFNPSDGSIAEPTGALTLPWTQPSTIEARLTNLYLRILRAERAIKHSRDGPRLIVVQYPSMLTNQGSGNCLLSSTTLNLAALPRADGLYPGFTNASANELVQISNILRAETAVVVKNLHSQGYLGVAVAQAPSTFTPLDCQTGSSPDLNGLVLNLSPSGVGIGSFHPTASGQTKMAESVDALWRKLKH